MASFIILPQWDILLCDNYTAIYHREFDGTKSHAVIFTPEALQSCREKLTYKYNKIINIAIARKILFVRYTTLQTPVKSRYNNLVGVPAPASHTTATPILALFHCPTCRQRAIASRIFQI